MADYWQGRISVVRGDITTLDVDAVVNAANTSLLGGGGVDGAIHKAAGPELLAACLPLNGARTGEAKITPGFALPARHVIHAVGPVWHGGHRGEDDLLASAYRMSLGLAHQHGLATLAFPAISTGIYGFPIGRATRIAMGTVLAFGEQHEMPQHVIFCCFSAQDQEVYDLVATDVFRS
jgi:O-acetyl-ADP-ribose deacetylase (regulator of RNase III)